MSAVGVELSYEMIPIRASREDDFVVLIIELENPSDNKKLISIDLISNNDQISFDTYRVKKKEEIRVGVIDKNSRKEFPIKLYLQRPRARPGYYEISILVYLHDRDYSSYIEKEEYKVGLRIV